MCTPKKFGSEVINDLRNNFPDYMNTFSDELKPILLR